jgi:hypothetical protein
MDDHTEALLALAEARAALKVAHHALTTVHGLWVTDKYEETAGQVVWQLDKRKALEQIEAVLEEGVGPDVQRMRKQRGKPGWVESASESILPDS